MVGSMIPLPLGNRCNFTSRHSPWDANDAAFACGDDEARGLGRPPGGRARIRRFAAFRRRPSWPGVRAAQPGRLVGAAASHDARRRHCVHFRLYERQIAKMIAVSSNGAPLTIPAFQLVPAVFGWLCVTRSEAPWCPLNVTPPPSTFPLPHEANPAAQPPAPI